MKQPPDNQVIDPQPIGIEGMLHIVPKISPSDQSNPKIVEYFLPLALVLENLRFKLRFIN